MADNKKDGPKGPRALFNRGGMSIKLKPGPDGVSPLFAPGTSFIPREGVMYGGKVKDGKLVGQEIEEQFLKDYQFIVYADQITASAAAAGAQQLKDAQDRVAALEKENAELKAKAGGKDK